MSTVTRSVSHITSISSGELYPLIHLSLAIIDDIEKTQERFGRFHIDGLTKACKEIIKCLNDKLAAHCRDAKIHTKQETSCPVPVLVHEIHVYLTRYLNITTEKAREEDRVYYAIQ